MCHPLHLASGLAMLRAAFCMWLLGQAIVSPAQVADNHGVPVPLYYYTGVYGVLGGVVTVPAEAAAELAGKYALIDMWAQPNPIGPFHCTAEPPTFSLSDFVETSPPTSASVHTTFRNVPATFGVCAAWNPGGVFCTAAACGPVPSQHAYGMSAGCPVNWVFRSAGGRHRCECSPGYELARDSSGRWTCQWIAPPAVDNPNCWRADGSCPVGNPILPGVATKVQEEVDYEGAGAHALQFRRTFRSNGARPFRDSGAWSHWVHNWGRRIETFPGTGQSTARAYVIRDDASQKVYTTTGSGTWTAWQVGDRDRLVEDRDATGQRKGFRYLLWADNSVEHYDLDVDC